ncbi:hypothetical protein BJ508DRAFT_329849 [Ascobolus immersus RN42]|uniref:Uncharacterized protein n=1 Tax=Ascobolus immersus RN42 TaxID=1160509 RepID=A0A3N4HW01_ASCIM|nr:hypothetical protein BJ508DRAFT_329849 [Ascobolus immersus RN42]
MTFWNTFTGACGYFTRPWSPEKTENAANAGECLEPANESGQHCNEKNVSGQTANGNNGDANDTTIRVCPIHTISGLEPGQTCNPNTKTIQPWTEEDWKLENNILEKRMRRAFSLDIKGLVEDFTMCGDQDCVDQLVRLKDGRRFVYQDKEVWILEEEDCITVKRMRWVHDDGSVGEWLGENWDEAFIRAEQEEVRLEFNAAKEELRIEYPEMAALLGV